MRPVQTRFRCGSVPEVLNLAAYNNSPDRSTKSTLSGLNALQLLVNIGFQVLFHSPPGVLFTFPSRYCSTIGHQLVFSLGRWSSLLPTGFHVPRGTPDAGLSSCLSRTGLLPSADSSFQMRIPLDSRNHSAGPLPRMSTSCTSYQLSVLSYQLNFLWFSLITANWPLSTVSTKWTPGLGSSAFARHYLRNHCCFLFLQVLRCFSSLRLPPYHYVFMVRYPGIHPGWVPPFGNPRVDGYLRLIVAYRSLSRPSSAPGA